MLLCFVLSQLSIRTSRAWSWSCDFPLPKVLNVVSPVESALPKKAPVTPLESADPKTEGVGGKLLTKHSRFPNAYRGRSLDRSSRRVTTHKCPPSPIP